MFAVGFEMYIIKRRGRWVSATCRQYLWRDVHILPNISHGMIDSAKKDDSSLSTRLVVMVENDLTAKRTIAC